VSARRGDNVFEQIAELIGLTAARKLQSAFGGVTVYIPVGEDEEIKRRNRAIRAACNRARDNDRPLPIAKLMADHDLSRRQIFSILGERD
jgi:Mor family transcriptional regulator